MEKESQFNTEEPEQNSLDEQRESLKSIISDLTDLVASMERQKANKEILDPYTKKIEEIKSKLDTLKFRE